MTNQDILYNNLNIQSRNRTNYTELVVVAKSCLTDTCGSGKSYAILRCLQKYYVPENRSPAEIDSFSIGDPRDYENLSLVKDSWNFIMKDNTSASKTPTRKKDGNNAIKNREEFIKSIEKFIDYLVVAWDDLEGFQFENKSLRRNRISNDKVSVYKSLNDAFLDYQWNNHGFIETTKGLIVFRKKIRSSEVINDRYKLYITINEILRWGGVLKDDIAGRFLDMVLTGDLVMYIQWARDSFSANSNNLSVLSEAPPPSKLASDSGATKVYTMLCDGCVIYDDRVAASLCLLISKYLGENNLLPAPLKLMSGKRGSKKKNLEDTQGTNRDPSTKNHRFIRKTTGEEHAYSNLKANWIILTMARKLMRSNDRFSALVNQSCEKMYNKNINHDDKTWVAMRIIETSLFMAGHSVPLFPIE